MSDTPERVTTDQYTWDRLIMNLVKAGYGSYKEAANANLEDAVRYLFLSHRRTSADSIRKHFGR